MKSKKESVRLRQRKTSTGNISLYLDIYRNGKREYEYLKMYLVPEKTRADKEKNRATLRLAEAVQAKRVVEIQNNEYGFKSEGRKVPFFGYCYAFVQRQKLSDNSLRNLKSLIHKLEEYEKDKEITFDRIDKKWVEGFREFLHSGKSRFGKNTLSANSQSSYFTLFRQIIRDAIAKEIISHNPFAGVKTLPKEESRRMYLTLEEMKAAAATECGNETVKRIFLFSCLTGLRWSDCSNLTWGMVTRQGEYTRIMFTQKKTKGVEYIDLTRQAAELMGERGKDSDLVFPIDISKYWSGVVLADWMKRAGIKKKITFHCARHTFAVLMLDLGTDIYTVSKLLGHRNVSTTQIYAKVLDKNKQAAVDRIPNIME